MPASVNGCGNIMAWTSTPRPCATGPAGAGHEAGHTFAEGFCQHLGHSYPQDDILILLFEAADDRMTTCKSIAADPSSIV